jgi:pyruvate kinase
MIGHAYPSRAEASDIHSAVMDGADCLCLNKETNFGKYPIESVQTMNKVCLAAEQQFNY